MLNVYSMFAGIGGFDLGLEATGYFHTVMQSEIEKYPQSILVEHWPEAIQVGDCTKVNYAEHDVQIDVICGGFPCQDISIAGRQKGITGDRSSLFSEMLRAANHYKPKYILFENVRRLLSINNGEDFLYVLSEINEAGYNAEWRIVSAESVGAPHKRERLFIVAYAKELGYASGEGLQGFEPTSEYHQSTFWDTEDCSGNETLADTNMPGYEAATQRGSDEKTSRAKIKDGQENRGKLADNRAHHGGSVRPEIFIEPPKRSTYWGSAIQYRNRLVEPNIPLLADGVSNRAHQIKAYGNAIVPQVAEYVGQMVKQFDERLSVASREAA